jgi:DDB1- and CUL4-associated factor 13
MFSKPFVDALEGHGDGLYSMTKDESGGLSRIASGSGDGEVRVWDLAQRKSLWNVQGAHRGMVKGVAFSHPAAGEEGRVEKKVGAGEKSLKRKRTALGDKGKGRQGEESDDEEDFDYDTTLAKGSSRLLTCGVDKTVKLWDVTGAKGANVKVSRPRSGLIAELGADLSPPPLQPLQTYAGKSGFKFVSLTPMTFSAPR